ncbi:hypothetical protein RJ639_046786 [Escallonia herrerae]|uniref:Arp2/3 complex 34 kDa subunit n=1 Tax=Escallonia herrerae TaxID=1293975 RepID=A0AA88W9M3_9ASTE|nr:hypothetical protein RJ639_046786 [Escallonia herrerae]
MNTDPELDRSHKEPKDGMLSEGITSAKGNFAETLPISNDKFSEGGPDNKVLSQITVSGRQCISHEGMSPSSGNIPDKPTEIDHHLYEFGSVEYHIQASLSEPNNTYLSISTPLLSQGVLLSHGLPRHTTEMFEGIPPDVLEIVEPAREGYQLTLRLDLARIPRKKDSVKMITQISSVQAAILSFQLKEILRNISNEDLSLGMYKPLKLVYHPSETFFVVKQPTKFTAVFPMRFKENTDVSIATAFFQELMDVGSSTAFAKAPPCHWSPIPPPELRGELIEDLSTNGGFVSFEISSRHVEGKKLDKTVWGVLNFYSLVKYHVKNYKVLNSHMLTPKINVKQCTRGFIQRRIRKRLQNLVERSGYYKIIVPKEVQLGYRRMRKLISLSRSKLLKGRRSLTNKIKRIGSRIKIHAFNRFRRRWLTFPRFSSVTSYTY